MKKPAIDPIQKIHVQVRASGKDVTYPSKNDGTHLEARPALTKIELQSEESEYSLLWRCKEKINEIIEVLDERTR